jgi:uncharacterized protein (DUF697 family)
VDRYYPAMSRVLEVAVKGDPKAIVTKAKGVAQKYGAVFDGDHVSGKFAGNGISGTYKFVDRVVVVTIENKPDFAPWPMVEHAIRGFFEADPEPVGETAPIPAAEAAAVRRERIDGIIRKHVLWASGAGLIPIPLADVAAVTGVQVSMLRDITRIYKSELSEADLQNFITALTGGMLARLGASAVKAIPGIGTLLGGASMSIMSGASTYAVGRVARTQLEASGNLAAVDLDRAKREYKQAYESGKDYVSKLKNDDPEV